MLSTVKSLLLLVVPVTSITSPIAKVMFPIPIKSIVCVAPLKVALPFIVTSSFKSAIALSNCFLFIASFNSTASATLNLLVSSPFIKAYFFSSLPSCFLFIASFNSTASATLNLLVSSPLISAYFLVRLIQIF